MYEGSKGNERKSEINQWRDYPKKMKEKRKRKIRKRIRKHEGKK